MQNVKLSRMSRLNTQCLFEMMCDEVVVLRFICIAVEFYIMWLKKF